MKTRLLLLAAALGLAAGCGGDGAPGEAKPQQQPTSGRTGSAGVTVELVDGWHTTTWDDGAISDPQTRIVVASGPIARKETACQVAQYEFAADAVALVVLEWREPLRTLHERPIRFTSSELPVQPSPAVECFDGSGGALSFIDHGRAFGVYLLVGSRAGDQTIEQARRVLDTLQVERRQHDAAPQRLERNSISVAIHTDWDGRVLFREAAGRTGIIFQLANFELPANEGLQPPRELPPGEEDPIKAMGDDDVLVMIIDGVEAATAVANPPTVESLTPIVGPQVPHGHSLAQGSVCLATRCVGIEVDFGAAQPADDLIRRVNGVLASLAVDD